MILDKHSSSLALDCTLDYPDCPGESLCANEVSLLRKEDGDTRLKNRRTVGGVELLGELDNIFLN